MNENKYPSLEWCEKYGHLFEDDTDCIWFKSRHSGKTNIQELGGMNPNGFIAYCPDISDIMDWLWEKDCVQIFRVRFFKPDKKGDYYDIFKRGLNKPWNRIEATNWLEALMQAVELVEEIKDV